MESYEKKYKNALEWARQVMNGKTGFIRKEVEEVFPELAESEDEKIRKELIEHIKANKWADYVLFQKFSPDDVIAWLEKQESVEEIVARCKDSWYNEGKIAGMAEGLTDDEKYQQGWHDALEKQGEKPQGKTALEGANEEKADNANKVEPKFKVKYAGSEYNVLEIKESAGVTFYGIEDEANHIDYVLSDDCEIISGYGVKEKGNSYPTKSATFSEQTSAWNEEDEKNLRRAIWYVEHSAINVVKDTMLSEWLKSIKERVQPQPKQ